MMAVIGFRLRPSEQNRAAVLRQAIGYIWVPPPENPLGLEHTVRFRPTATQGKSALPSRLRWKTPPFGVPVFPVAAHHTRGKTPRVGLPDPKGGATPPRRGALLERVVRLQAGALLQRTTLLSHHTRRPLSKVTTRTGVLYVTKYLTSISLRVSSVPEGTHGSGCIIANQAFPLFPRRRRPLLPTRPSLLQPCSRRRYRLLVHCYLAALPPRAHADFPVPLHHPRAHR